MAFDSACEAEADGAGPGHLRHADRLPRSSSAAAADPPLITAGGRLQSRLKVGEVALDGWLKPLFDLYAEQPPRAQPPALHRLPRHHLHGRRPAHQHPLPRHRPLRLRRGELSRSTPELSHLLTVSLRLDRLRTSSALESPGP